MNLLVTAPKLPMVFLCKVLFCDYVRALHIIAGIPSVDLGNCYDAISHPIASIAMQALKVPVMTVVLALSVLQTMTFLPAHWIRSKQDRLRWH